jgi:uncharacterized membrane protein YfcA
VHYLLYVAVYLVGIIAGFMNVLAGGGSMLTLPMLSLLGLDVGVANGTNRVAILLQNIVAAEQFKKKKVNVLKRSLILAIPATLGAIVGSTIAVQMNEDLFKKLIGFFFIFLAIFLVWKPKVWEKGIGLPKNLRWLSYIIFFGVGIYGGFIQAGVGFLFILSLVLAEGMDIIKTNAAKVTIIALYTIASLIIFIINGKVNWIAGLTLAAGNITGAIFGTHFAILKGAKWVRYVLFAAVILSTIKFFV